MDMRRELSRPSKKHYHHHQLLVSGEKELRREKERRLSIVQEMGGCDGFQLTPKKFKLPRKVFGDTGSVHPASVPRKLRSAIKKRSCESVAGSLPDSKRLGRLMNSVEPLRNDCSKKSKLSMNGCSDHSTKQDVSVSISKDEEEVAETLFAMAGMIPLDDIRTKDKIGGELLEGKGLDLVEKPNDLTPMPEDSVKLKVETEVTCCAASGVETNATATCGELPRESVQEKSSIEAAPLSWPNLSERRHLSANLEVSVPQLNLQAIPPLLRTCDQRSWVDSTFFSNSTGPSLASGLKEIKQEKVLLPYRGSHATSGVVDTRSSDRHHATSIEINDEGLTSKALHRSGLDGRPLQSSTIVFPSWLNTATSSELVTRGDAVSTDKVLRSGTSGRRSWKKCAAHVHISHLIQELQALEGKDTQPLDASQLRPSQCLTERLVPPEHSNIARDAISGMATSSRICGSIAYTRACEASNAMAVNQKLGDQEEGPSKTKSFDFLSLSAGMSSAAGNGITINRPGNNLEPGAKSHIFYLHSVAQHSPLPFSAPLNCLPSNSYGDQVAAISGSASAPTQVHLQVPPYFGNHFGPTHMGSTATAAQQSQRNLQHQQQQQIWTAQLAARFRPGPLLSSHIANWQNRRQDLRSSTHHIQALLPPPQPSLEVLGAKYAHISQQQPQLVGLGPLVTHTKAKPQHNQLSICEDNGGRFHPDGVLPLQLLCSEQL